jgi:GNAT superfamily N-acetyltransferase
MDAPDGYVIRLAAAGEVAALPAIEAAAAQLHAGTGLPASVLAETSSVEHLEAARRRGHLLVAVARGGPPRGFLVLEPLGDDLYLGEVDVDPAHGRRGVGRALVEAAIALGRAAGAPRMVLSTMRDLPFNAPFYASLGFRTLADDELTAGLRAMREGEARRGLPLERRVIMVRAL